MGRHIQLDLFAQPAWRETVLRRLPACDFLTVPEVALAFAVSAPVVQKWIDEGRLEAGNLNFDCLRKAFYRIPRASVLRLIDQIAAGC